MRKLEHVKGHVATSTIGKSLLDKEVRIIYDFTTKVFKEFGTFIKTVALYGSFIRHQLESDSDVDVLILIDDASVHLTPKLMDYYEKELAKILREEGSPLKLHVNTLTLSEFWEGVRIGDPVIINIIRDGIPVADTGFFSPVKLMLEKGKIRPSEEAVDFSMSRAYLHLINYRRLLLDAANELYWTVTDAGHALLMREGVVPPTPRDIPKMMQEKLVKKGKVSSKEVKLVEKLYNMMKAITHGRLQDITGNQLDKLDDQVEDYLQKMTNILLKKPVARKKTKKKSVKKRSTKRKKVKKKSRKKKVKKKTRKRKR
jgi:predicted nucleotidyltransferase/uncharacterized protein (UPF0332 family)